MPVEEAAEPRHQPARRERRHHADRHFARLGAWSTPELAVDRVQAREDLGQLESPGLARVGELDAAREALKELRRKLRFERRSEERRVGKECRSRWSAYH